MCVFVQNLTCRPVVAGNAALEQPSASEMETENITSDIIVPKATKSAEVSSWSDVSEVPKKKMVSTGCGTSSQTVESGVAQVDSVQQKSVTIPQSDNSTRKIMVSSSTGTSPPPQSISTQVGVIIKAS